MSKENIPFWTWVLSWVKGNWWKTIFTTYSCLDSSAFWTLNCTMYYELCNPKVDVILPNWQSESQGAIYPYEWCSQYELRATRGGNEEEIHRVWTPSEACPCWSCLAASPMDSTLCLVPVWERQWKDKAPSGWGTLKIVSRLLIAWEKTHSNHPCLRTVSVGM